MTATPVLDLLDLTHTSWLSETGIGAMLMEDTSRSHSQGVIKKEPYLINYEKEMLVIIHAMTKWRPYDDISRYSPTTEP